MGMILVVDDEPDICALMVRLFRRSGHDVTYATSGPEALARVQGAAPDVILLDVMMPEMSGLDVLKRIRTDSGRHVPVIIYSALSDPEIQSEALESGADDYWVKATIDIQEILRRIGRYLPMDRPH